jgi:8-oxo-dGTP pyrophosphatase MutT (NUDIX family)
MSSEAEFHQIVAVAVAVFRGDRVLCLRRAPHRDAGAGLWETVSGRVAPGEDPRQAALREAREETGLEVELDPRPVDIYAAHRGSAPMTVVVFRAALGAGQGESDVRLSEEHDAYAFFAPRELPERTPERLAAAVLRAAATDPHGERGHA